MSIKAIAEELKVDLNLLEAILQDIATAPIEERFRSVFALGELRSPHCTLLKVSVRRSHFIIKRAITLQH